MTWELLGGFGDRASSLSIELWRDQLSQVGQCGIFMPIPNLISSGVMARIEAGSFALPDTYSESDVIRVVSWNINRGLQLNGVVEFLRNSGADLILLQECDINARRTGNRDIAREIAQALQMNYVFGYEFQELTQGTHNSPAYHGQATLSRFPLSRPRVLRFQRQSGFWRPRRYIPNFAVLQRRIGGRIALVSHVHCRDKHLVAYNVHLESRGDDGIRDIQLGEVLEDVNHYSPEMPVLIAGDFNFDLSQPLEASWIASSEFENPFRMRDAMPTTKSSRLGAGRSVDWILVRKSLRHSYPELHNSVPYSDHYPLSLLVQLGSSNIDQAGTSMGRARSSEKQPLA